MKEIISRLVEFNTLITIKPDETKSRSQDYGYQDYRLS